MFEIEYRIAEKMIGYFIGEEGYYKIHCNEKTYGDIYPEELEEIMGTEYLYDWFEDMLKIAIELHDRRYIVLSEIESYNLWIEFERKGEDLFVSLAYADKPDGSKEIEYELFNQYYDESLWKNERIDFEAFKLEVVRKSTEYSQEIKRRNRNLKFEELDSLIKELEKLMKAVNEK